MSGINPIKRRDFLKYILAGSTLVWAGSAIRVIAASDARDRPAASDRMNAGGVVIDMAAVEGQAAILSGRPTYMWHYKVTGITSNRLDGNVQYLNRDATLPIIRVRRGDRLRVNFTNLLPEATTIHWHGLHVPADMDGHPADAVLSGKTRTYEFDIIDWAGTYWFHPHPHRRTGSQVYAGLVGVLLVSDDDEDAVVSGLSQGQYDVPLVLQDASFNRNNQLLYRPSMFWGMLGDQVLVNRRVNHRLDLSPRAYRFRIVNASNARIYKLGWSMEMPWHVVGTDGGLLARREERSYLILAPGERVDAWIDFAPMTGQQLLLRSLPFETGNGMMGGGMMGGMMGSGMMGGMMSGQMMDGMMVKGGAIIGQPFDVLAVTVSRMPQLSPEFGNLPPLPSVDPATASNYRSPRRFTLGIGMMMAWTMNGRTFNENDWRAVSQDEQVRLGDTEIWEWFNNTDVPHPIHIHNVQFRVIQRLGSGTAYETVREGFVDNGWKDTFVIWPGERVQLILHFQPPYTGVYLYHCHLLEHEDAGMMRNYEILAE